VTTLPELVDLSHQLGQPEHRCAILGEGNTSARCDDESFWVKGSGCTLATMQAEDFVRLRCSRILSLMDGEPADEARLKAVYEDAKIDTTQRRRPSVEALFHAVLLSYPGVAVVAHTHPTAINSLTCTPNWEQTLTGRLFPDEAVVLGRASVFIPYMDPGVILARRIKAGVDEYLHLHGELPKVIYLQNHGLIAVAANATEAVNISLMAVKAAEIRLGALLAGGFKALDQTVVAHLLARPDEKYRQQQLRART